jgi:hypothetical protein
MTDYGYVVIHETKDAARGEMLAELLRNEGIEARFRGASSTLIGLAQNIVAMTVEVPIGQEERALQFLRDLEDTSEAIDSGAAGRLAAPGVAAEEGGGERRRRRPVAVAVAVAIVVGVAIFAARSLGLW